MYPDDEHLWKIIFWKIACQGKKNAGDKIGEGK
jgi:hypothetical protein